MELLLQLDPHIYTPCITVYGLQHDDYRAVAVDYIIVVRETALTGFNKIHRLRGTVLNRNFAVSGDEKFFSSPIAPFGDPAQSFFGSSCLCVPCESKHLFV